MSLLHWILCIEDEESKEIFIPRYGSQSSQSIENTHLSKVQPIYIVPLEYIFLLTLTIFQIFLIL